MEEKEGEKGKEGESQYNKGGVLESLVKLIGAELMRERRGRERAAKFC